MTIKLKDIKEVFNDYKKTSLLLVVCDCNFKCEKEGLCTLGSCQNSHLSKLSIIEIANKKIIEDYKNNNIVNAIIFGGLEPFLQFDEVYNFIKEFRKENNDDVILYSGYYPNEIRDYVLKLKEFNNIIIKFGRYVENSEPIFDKLLGISLVSKNQFAKRIEDL